MPKLRKKKSAKKERLVPYEVLTAKTLTRSRTSFLNVLEPETALSELQKLDEMTKTLEEYKSELENILNKPKLQKCVQKNLSLNSPKICKQRKLSTEPKPVQTPTKEKVSRKRSVSSTVVKRSKKNNAYINTESPNGEFAMEDCPMDLSEDIRDQDLNNCEIHRERESDQSLGDTRETGNAKISRNEESNLEHFPHQVNETDEHLDDSSPAIVQVPMQQSSESDCEKEDIRNVFHLESENVRQNVEESNSNEWQVYFTELIGNVVQSTSSFFRHVFEEYLKG